MEQAKVRIRQVREETKAMWKKEANLPEDLARSFEDELNKITKLYNSKLEDTFAKKEQELLKV
jgi:ribosome recycling factor